MEVSYDDGRRFEFSFEFLRVFLPSAEVRGPWNRSGGSPARQARRGYRAHRTVGNYAIKPVFSDGRDSGLYSWDYLYDLGENHDDLWQTYLLRLAEAGGAGIRPMQPLRLLPTWRLRTSSLIQWRTAGTAPSTFRSHPEMNDKTTHFGFQKVAESEKEQGKKVFSSVASSYDDERLDVFRSSPLCGRPSPCRLRVSAW